MSDIVIADQNPSDTEVEIVVDSSIDQTLADCVAAKVAAEAAKTASETAQANAEAAEANAESAKYNAQAAELNATGASNTANNYYLLTVSEKNQTSIYASNASASATQASGYATTALSYASNASDSAADASASESNAQTYATNASNSATSAENDRIATSAMKQALDNKYGLIEDFVSLTPTDGNFVVADGVNWVTESGNTARTSLGLGDADSVTHADITVGSIQYTGGTGTQGTVSWNTDEETLSLIQNGNILEIGQEHQVHCRNNTVSAITKGTVVMATGTLGASGRITVAPYDNTSDVKYILGVAAYDIASGEDGKVTTFGKIKNLDTSSYLEGDVLYTAASGGLTKTIPTTGTKNAIAFVISVHAVNGTIMVRTQSFNELAYEPADATILKDADIGVNVQAYSSVLANTTASYTTEEEAKLASYPDTYTTVTEW